MMSTISISMMSIYDDIDIDDIDDVDIDIDDVDIR